MRFVADIYLGLYAVLALANLICCLKGGENKPGPWQLAYESVSGLLTLFMAAAFLHQSLRPLATWPFGIAFIAVLAMDFKISVWGTREELGTVGVELGDGEFETAKAIALLVAGPAYAMGALLTVELFVH